MTSPNEPTDAAPESASAAEQAAATPQWPSQPGASQPYGTAPSGEQPAAYPPMAPPVYGPTPQASNSAIAALVLSIVSWVVCPIIPAIIALVFAGKADREIAAGNGWVTGGGMVTAAKIVSWINIGLYAGLIAIGLLVLVLLAIGGAFSSV